MKNLNERKPLKVVGRTRPSDRSPMEPVKKFITNSLDRWMEVFGAYDPDACGLISKAQFIEGLKVRRRNRIKRIFFIAVNTKFPRF